MSAFFDQKRNIQYNKYINNTCDCSKTNKRWKINCKTKKKRRIKPDLNRIEFLEKIKKIGIYKK